MTKQLFLSLLLPAALLCGSSATPAEAKQPGWGVATNIKEASPGHLASTPESRPANQASLFRRFAADFLGQALCFRLMTLSLGNLIGFLVPLLWTSGLPSNDPEEAQDMLYERIGTVDNIVSPPVMCAVSLGLQLMQVDKKMLDMEIVDRHGKKVNKRTLFLRTLCKSLFTTMLSETGVWFGGKVYAAALICFLINWAGVFTKDGRPFHDRIMDTYVVMREEKA